MSPEPTEPTIATPPAPVPPVPGQSSAPAPAVEMPAQPVEAQTQAPAELPEEWPCRGYTGPQPWEVSNPPALMHDRGLVASGAAGEHVVELAACLAHLGYPTSISRGENPLGVYGGSEREAVAAFHRDYGVAEDPAVIAASTADVVGPWTWEALFRLLGRA